MIMASKSGKCRGRSSCIQMLKYGNEDLELLNLW